MLSERPNVRVHNDPLRMCPARESRLLSRDAKRQGRLFFGSFLWGEQRNEQEVIFSLVVEPANAGSHGPLDEQRNEHKILNIEYRIVAFKMR